MAIEFIDPKTGLAENLTEAKLCEVLREAGLEPDEFREPLRWRFQDILRERDGAPFYLGELILIGREAKEGYLDVIVSDDKTVEIFEQLLERAIRKFHKGKGRVIIANQAWEEFRNLDSSEWTLRSFREIIEGAVAVRRKENITNGADIRRKQALQAIHG